MAIVIMKYVIVVLSSLALAQAFDFTEEWELWKKEHGKLYSSDAKEHNRHEIWEANKKLIDLHNQNADQYGFTMEMNMFGDLQASEHARMYHGFIPASTKENLTSEHLFDVSQLQSVEDLPASLDWREKGYVTEVKTQGQCGSCWAFTATGALEGQHFKSTGKLVSLSEQNLMDCSGPEGNMGCSGGFMVASYKYVIKNGGIDTEDSYPYLAHQQRKCGFKKAGIGATCSSYKRVKNGSESDLLVAVATVGPIAVAVDATHSGFIFYKQGVYYEPKCNSESVEHSLLVVGYGSQDGQDFWIAKNSWGTKWGDKGYILMSRNKNNNCGIATLASYPII